MNNRKIIWIIFILVPGYWLLHSAIDAFIFKKGPFLTEIFSASQYDILVRFFDIALLVVLIYAFFVSIRQKKTEDEIKTALVRAEDEKSRTESIIEAIGDGITIQDRDFRILYQNQKMKELIGDHVGDLCYMAYEKREQRCDGCPVALVFEDGGVHTVIRTAPTDKGLIYVENTASPIKNSKGEIIAGIEVVHDITKRKLVENALREKEHLLSESQRIAHIGSWSWEIATDTLSWTDEAYRIYGRSPGTFALTPESFVSLIYPDDRPAMQEWIRACLAEEKPGNLVFRIVMPDNTIRFIDGRGDLQYDADNKPICMVGTAQDITERKKAEEALKEAELRFSSLMLAAGDAIIVSDASDNVLSWNTGAEKIFGYIAEEIIGKPLTTLMPDRYRLEHINGMQRIIKNRQSQYLGKKLEFHGIRKDGSEFPLELSVNAWQTQTGYYFLGIIRDITEHKRTEELLKEQKMFAESLVENSAVASFVISSEHKIVLWNKACEELTGMSASEMIGTENQWKPFYSAKRQTLADVVIDRNFSDLPVLYLKFSESSLMSKGLQSEGWYFNLNGKDRYIIFDAAPLFDSKGKLVFVIETLHDITERKELETALTESRERLKTIINTEPQCVKLLNADGTLIEMNPAGLAMIEAESFDQVKGASLYSLLAPEHVNAFKNHVAEVFAGGSGTLEFEVIGLKSTHRWLSTHSVPFRNSNGEIVALLGITRDITEQKKLEDQFMQAQKMEAIGQLAGGIAHDFNNLLSAIMGYTHLALMRMNESDPLRTNLDHVLEASEKAATLTQSLLAFSRKQTVHLSKIDINDLISKFEKFLLRLLREDIELKTKCSDDSHGKLMIMADSGQIEQVLMNLVTNARDAMPEGGRLTINTEPVEFDKKFIDMHGFGKPGKYAMISVSDNGSGIDEQTRERIFEPFFTTKEAGRGTGLGLAMVYGTIKKHDGYINVYSEKGKGTTFRIYLPIATEEVEKEKTEKLEALPVQSGTETILVAEDDATLRKLSSTVLKHYGYNIIEAEDGEDAVRKYFENKDRISLVILDGIMPKKNGKEAYDEMKILRPDIKVIFISGYSSDIFGAKGVIDKEINFIAKPVSPIKLAKKVRELLDK